MTLDGGHLQRKRLYHFVSKQALNVDGLGPRIIDLLLDHGLITAHADLFTLEVGDLQDLPGFKEKAAQNVVDQLVDAGIDGIVNFAPVTINLPTQVSHVGVDLASELEQITFAVAKRLQI